MRPEPFNYSEYFVDEDDVSSTAAVNEADDIFYEEKKRSATEDKNPGATKKSKADGEGEQIPAAAALPRPRLPNLILSMRNDSNYSQIINEAIQKIVGKEFSTNAEKEMGASILQKLQQDYHLLDTNGEPADDGVALHSKHIANVRLTLFTSNFTSNFLFCHLSKKYVSVSVTSTDMRRASPTNTSINLSQAEHCPK